MPPASKPVPRKVEGSSKGGNQDRPHTVEQHRLALKDRHPEPVEFTKRESENPERLNKSEPPPPVELPQPVAKSAPEAHKAPEAIPMQNPAPLPEIVAPEKRAGHEATLPAPVEKHETPEARLPDRLDSVERYSGHSSDGRSGPELIARPVQQELTQPEPEEIVRRPREGSSPSSRIVNRNGPASNPSFFHNPGG